MLSNRIDWVLLGNNKMLIAQITAVNDIKNFVPLIWGGSRVLGKFN